MSVYFQSRKYGTVFNCEFSVKDGLNSDSLDRFLKGDSVHILFEIAPVQARQINALADSSVRAYNTGFGTARWGVHIPFTIVERTHALAFNQRRDAISHLRALGTSIYLEAQNGYWEDIYCWICMGEKPAWAESEAESEAA